MDDGLNWDGIIANVTCQTDNPIVNFSSPLDISDFDWSCSFAVNGVSYGCADGGISAWESNGGGQTINFSNQLDFACGGACQPVSGDELSWSVSVDSIGVGYPPVTIFQGSTSTSASVTVP